MTTITLNIEWRGHQPGDTIEVDDPTAEWLRASGAVAPATPETPAPEQDAPVAPEPAPESPEKDQQPDPAPKAERPYRTAPVATWRAFATTLGIDPKGLTKAEIIAATNGA